MVTEMTLAGHSQSEIGAALKLTAGRQKALVDACQLAGFI